MYPHRCVENYAEYIQDTLLHYRALIESLQNEGKQDEANVTKVRYNVYDIFLKMVMIARRETTLEACAHQYLGFLENIPENWIKTRAIVEEASSTDAEIEDIKLQCVEDLKKTFHSMCQR